MSLFRRPIRAGAISVMGLAMIALGGAFSVPAMAATSSAAPQFVAMKDSVPATSDARTGLFHSSSMSVQVVLAAQHQAQMNALLASLYNPASRDYQHWLAQGQFNARFAPTSGARAAVAGYLRGAGLRVTTSSSPFLVRATGSSQQVSSAFRTTLSTYRDSHGVTYYSNSTAVRLPRSLVSGVVGVVGLSNTVREHPMVTRINNVMRPGGKSAGAPPSCQTTYPTNAQLFAFYIDSAPLPFGYGGGPGCNGLTPSQTNSIYGAPRVGPRGKGAGATEAVFELSAYQESDIATWAHPVLRPALHPAAEERQRGRRPAEPDLPGR